MDWKVRGIRGATTVAKNTKQAIKEAVTELLDKIEAHNQLDPEEIICVFFTATGDLDAVFPAAVARSRPGWNNIPLLDLQQMHVKESLERCIRVLIQVNTSKPQSEIVHCYLRDAIALRRDWGIAQISSASSSVESH
ncbi:chorismate mutase [Pleurocapsales cyanobacterium LEGE 06147]|nr:chorismate mutase [Pleurocapsales cyanobacterium LEGE 06147]